MKIQNRKQYEKISVKVIASGSDGNCTALTYNGKTILLDAGIQFSRILKALDFQLPSAAFITHEHGDHLNKRTVKELLKRGAEVHMTPPTIEAAGLAPHHNLYNFTGLAKCGQFLISGFQAIHDAACPYNFLIRAGNSQIAYIIDTGAVAPIFSGYGFTHILIEANYSEKILAAAAIDEWQKKRIAAYHLSSEKAALYLGGLDRKLLKEVHFLHVSKRHGNVDKLLRLVQSFTENIKVFAH